MKLDEMNINTFGYANPLFSDECRGLRKNSGRASGGCLGKNARWDAL
jgi:hypothetical protein